VAVLNPSRQIVLTDTEITRAAWVGVQRQLASLRRRSPHAHGYDRPDPYLDHIEGAFGELAAARALGLAWLAGVNTYRSEGDLAGGVEVRTRKEHHHDLYVRDDDDDDRFYVLVTGQAGAYRVHGGILGRDAKRADWKRILRPGRPPVYLVPQHALKPLA
jgi:hypothetical protein